MFANRKIWLWIATGAVASAQEVPPKPVSVVTVDRSPVVTRLELTGSVTARRQARLSARTAGLIKRLHVDAGSVVKAGDVLMELDDELAAISLDRVLVEREQAELELAEAERLESEARKLAKTGAFAKSEADSRQTILKVRTSALRAAKVTEREMRSIVERHRLLAPFDGVISAKLAEEGEWVQTGTPVVELVETGSVRLDVRAPQEAYERLTGNPSLAIALDAYPDEWLTGKLAVIVPVKDAVARTFLARIEMDDPRGLAAPGMSGRVIFKFTGNARVIQVPRDAVVRFPDGTAKVWTVTGDGRHATASSRTVRLGQSLKESIEVSEGIDAGARVVIRGNEGLREGQAVEILPAEPGTSPEAE
jgi:RND family efflux transporter MFP subunit